MSYQLKVSPKNRTAARFITKVVKELQGAFAEEKKRHGITQQSVARALDVDRSAVNRALMGRNLTLRTVGELIWALGRDYEFRIVAKQVNSHQNFPVIRPALTPQTSTSASS